MLTEAKDKVVTILKTPAGEHVLREMFLDNIGQIQDVWVKIEAMGNSLPTILNYYRSDLGLPVDKVLRRFQRQPDDPVEARFSFRTKL